MEREEAEKKKKELEKRYNKPKESRIGKRLSEITTKQVIILVLLLILLMPLFAPDYWVHPDASQKWACNSVNKLLSTSGVT